MIAAPIMRGLPSPPLSSHAPSALLHKQVAGSRALTFGPRVILQDRTFQEWSRVEPDP